MEERKLVSCLGPEGSFSHRAAALMRPDCELILCQNFATAVHKLTSGEVDYCVLPIENSLNGGVLECLDILEREDIFGTEEFLLAVDHRLATLEGVKPEDIRCIYSHIQAIAQCSQYIQKNFSGVKVMSTSSTSESLSLLDRHSAGIVGAHIKREGVVLSEENIADNKSNFTRFLLVERRNKIPEKSAMVFFSALCRDSDRPGSLLGLLKIFQRHGINLTRIESRPVKDAFGKYRFFIEIAGDIGSDWVKRALAEAENYCSQYKLLGAYN